MSDEFFIFLVFVGTVIFVYIKDKNKNKITTSYFLRLARSGSYEELKVAIDSGINLKDKIVGSHIIKHNNRKLINVSLETASAYNQDPEVIKLLLSNKFDLDDKKELNTMLFVSLQNKNPEIAQLFIDLGADVNNKVSETHILHDKSGGTEPIFFSAVENKNSKIIKIIVEAGANINMRNDMNQNILMKAAMYSDNSKIFEELIRAGVDIKATDNYNRTALDYAIGYNEDAIEILQSYGVK